MKRTIFMLLSGVVVLLVVGAIVFFLKIDTIAKKGLEKYGSEMFGTQMTLTSIDLSAASGEGSIKGLTIANPQGFSTSHAFMMSEVEMRVEPKSVPTDEVVIDQVVMDNPEIIYEVTKEGNNYAILRKNVNDYMSKDSSHTADGIIASKQVIIKDFYLRNGKVKVIAPGLGNKSFMVSLPTIHLSDLGKDQGKGNLPHVMEQISTVITNSVVSAVGNVTFDNFMKFLPNTVTGAANQILNQTGTAFQNAGEGIGEVLGK